jgi:hypothetical protein
MRQVMAQQIPLGSDLLHWMLIAQARIAGLEGCIRLVEADRFAFAAGHGVRRSHG